MTRTLLLAAVAILLPSCASSLSLLSDRGVMSDHLDKPHDRNKYRTQVSDRRGISLIERRSDGRLVICPEPFAGAMTARGASSAIALTGTGELTDAITATIQAVDGRAATVRLYQDAAYQYCLRYQDGSYTNEAYINQLDAITKWAFESLSKPPAAAESTPSATAPRTVPPSTR